MTEMILICIIFIIQTYDPEAFTRELQTTGTNSF